jgi:hypothetical protein
MPVRKRSRSADGRNDVIESSGASASLDDDPTLFTAHKKSKNKQCVSLSQPTASVSKELDTIEMTSANHVETCVFCDLGCSVTNAIQCKQCLHFHHLACCGIEPNIFHVALRIGNMLCWTCEACRLESCAIISKLRMDLNCMMSTLETMKSSIAQSQFTSNQSTSNTPDDRVCSSQTTNTANLRAPSAARPHRNVSNDVALNASVQGGLSSRSEVRSTQASIASVVLDTLRDVNRRKKNLIITGLPEVYRTEDDLKAVRDLFINHVRCPTLPVIISCTRLGNRVVSSSRPRKLLVRLSSEDEARKAIDYAKSLRISPDRNIALNVYINADLTKDEAKFEFEKRQLRRNTVSRSSSGQIRGDGHVDAASRAGDVQRVGHDGGTGQVGGAVHGVEQAMITSAPIDDLSTSTLLASTSDLSATATVFYPVVSSAIAVISGNRGLNTSCNQSSRLCASVEPAAVDGIIHSNQVNDFSVLATPPALVGSITAGPA